MATDPNRAYHYGLWRAGSNPRDFQVDAAFIGSATQAAVKYWESVLDRCNRSLRIFVAPPGGRDVFALGAVMVKSGHLAAADEHGRRIDYALADANEVQATERARSVLTDAGVLVPQVYFAGQLYGFQVLIEQRIPGISLRMRWPSLPPPTRAALQAEAHEILCRLHALKPPADRAARRDYVVPDPHLARSGRVPARERALLYGAEASGPDPKEAGDMGFMHNNVGLGNVIVSLGRGDRVEVVGLVNWGMAGYWGWEVAAKVHRALRMTEPQTAAGEVAGLGGWVDLYAERPVEVEVEVEVEGDGDGDVGLWESSSRRRGRPWCN